jgi:hypothetical protein
VVPCARAVGGDSDETDTPALRTPASVSAVAQVSDHTGRCCPVASCRGVVWRLLYPTDGPTAAPRGRYRAVRWVSRDGRWRVDLVSLSTTGRGRDGNGSASPTAATTAGEVRAWSDLARYLNPDDLRPVTLELSLACRRLQFGRHLGGERLHLLERRERQQDPAEAARTRMGVVANCLKRGLATSGSSPSGQRTPASCRHLVRARPCRPSPSQPESMAQLRVVRQ